MAYVFELGKPPEKPFVDALGVEIVEFVLGYIPERYIAVVMSVMLVPGGSYLEDEELEDIFDLRFGIRERDLATDWRVSPPDYTKETADAYIPKGARQAVLDNILLSLEILTSNTTATGITMETYYSNLPDKALTKYSEICEYLATCGYDQKDAFRDGNNGKNYWFLSLTD